MKRIFTILSLTFLFVSALFAQAPEKISYQAVIRGDNNQLAQLQEIGMQISILQGSENGTAVYVERHFPKTNENGLVTIQIGGGTVINGDFSAIDWSAGPYFLKTETDLRGGANYTISGTAQLLSVPYALYAKTAETLQGRIVETDPVYNKSVAKSISAEDTAKWNNKQGPMKAGFGIDFITDRTGVVIVSEIRYSIGDFAQGGIVFYVDESGEHGLVCSMKNQSDGVPWSLTKSNHTGAYNMGIFGGEANTTLIIAHVMSDNDNMPITEEFAALTARGGITDMLERKEIDSAMATFGDWYLPSIGELEVLNKRKLFVNNALVKNGGEALSTDYFYWSSTEQIGSQARCYSFPENKIWFLDKDEKAYVRAIRRF